jgi:Zn-finger nucleic acid-binding protein
MNCPVCSMQLLMSEKLSVEIDYCPKCRGIWLDRGELDKIIELSSVGRQTAGFADRRQQFGGEHERHHKDYHERYPHHKKRNFLEDLFD